MWLMLQQDSDDYVMATNETHSVKEFVQETFAQLDMIGNSMLIMIRDTNAQPKDLLIGDPPRLKTA